MGVLSALRQHGLSSRWLAVGIAMIVLAAIATLVYRGAQGAGSARPATVPVTRGTLVATVAGSGSVAAEQSVNLAFQTNGTVTEVLVKEGDVVQAGQVVARLDDRNLQSQVTTASSGLDSARARLAQIQNGNATQETIAASQAAVVSAQAAYDKVVQGASAAELASAEAAVNSAQAAYTAAVKSAETTNSKLTSAEAAVSSAQTTYNAAVKSAGTTSSQLTSARAALEKADAARRQAQSDYDKVAWMSDITGRPEAAALQNATTDYLKAKADYETLVQTADTDAKSKIDSAAAQLEQAKADYGALVQTGDTDAKSKINSAAAQLEQAQANLAKLTPNTQDLTSAQASLDQAKANLAKLTAAGTSTDLQIQQAAVSQAEQSLNQAELALEGATLKAPFAGIVTQVSVVPGSSVMAASATPALKLINRNPLHVDLRLSENDVANVQLDQPVSLTIQSLGNWERNGRVIYVAPAAENVNGVVTYVARVSFLDDDPRVKVGMTADLSIEVARKDDVLMVPNTALLPQGTSRVVQVLNEGGGRTQSGQSAISEVKVETGISDGSNTEILSGLSEGQQVIGLPSSGTRPSGTGSPFGGG